MKTRKEKRRNSSVHSITVHTYDPHILSLAEPVPLHAPLNSWVISTQLALFLIFSGMSSPQPESSSSTADFTILRTKEKDRTKKRTKTITSEYNKIKIAICKTAHVNLVLHFMIYVKIQHSRQIELTHNTRLCTKTQAHSDVSQWRASGLIALQVLSKLLSLLDVPNWLTLCWLIKLLNMQCNEHIQVANVDSISYVYWAVMDVVIVMCCSV